MIFSYKVKIAVTSWLIILATCRGYSENLMSNSGFELGSAGYHCLKHLRPDTNPKLAYEGPVADTSTYVSGEQSLRIPNRFAEAIYFSSDPAKIKPETAYTLSVWLRSSADNYPVVLIAKSSTRWMTFGTLKVNVGAKWTRYVLNFKTDKEDDYFKFCMLAGKESVPCDIWLDDLSVTANKEMKNGDPVAVEGYVAIDKLHIRNGTFEAAPAAMKLLNNLSKKISFKLGLDVTDRYTREKVFSKNISIELLPKERKSIDFTLPVANGGYVITPFTVDNIKSKFVPSLFAIAGEYKPQPVDVDKTFCIGLNVVPITVEQPLWAFVLGEKIASGIQVASPVSERFDLMRKMGCRLFRLWEAGSIRWSEIEPEEGKFDFTPIDRTLDFTEKYGINVLLVLGNMDFVDINTGRQYFAGSLPEWLKVKCSIREKFPLKRKYTEGKVYLPPLASWKKYAGETIKHCRGRISHYEIMNEPNLIFSNPNEYIDYVKTAWEVLKKYDETSKLLGPGVTGDLGGSPASFLGEYIAGGGLKYVDIVSFHPYNARELSSLMPADKQIEDFKNLCKKAGGKEYPLWNTELYYLFGADSNSFSDERLSNAHHSARRLLTDLGEGVKQSIAQPISAIWDSKIHPGQMEYPSLEQIPSSTYVTLNTLSRFFEGAKPIGKWRWLDRVICYVYEQRDGHYIAAFWNYREKTGGGLQLQLPDNAGNFELFDMFGNKQSLKGRFLEIGTAPMYIQWNNGSADTIHEILNHATVRDLEPFHVGRCIVPENMGKVLLSVTNVSGRKLDNVKVLLPDYGVSAGIGVFAPMEQKQIEFPIKTSTSKLRINISGADKPFSCVQAVSAVKSILLEGSRPSSGVQIKKPVIGKPDSPDDFSASFDLAREGNDLLLNVKVRDDQRSRLSLKGLWDEDAIQIYLDAFPEQCGSGYPAYADTTYKIIVAAHRDGKSRVSSDGFPGQVSAVVKLLPDGYEAEIRIPLSGIPGIGSISGKLLGFDISVEDSDTASRKTELVWNGTADNHRNRSQFGIVQINKTTIP